MIKYAVYIEPLPESEGGGFVAFAPDLPGCMSDGDTYEEAAKNIQDAIESWISVAEDEGDPIPAPGSAAEKAQQTFDLLTEAIEAMARLINSKNNELHHQEKELSQARADIDALLQLLRRDDHRGHFPGEAALIAHVQSSARCH